MNTKIILLATALLFTTPTSSVVSKVALPSKSINTEAHVQAPSQADVVPSTDNITFQGKHYGNDPLHAEKAPKQPEDGKHHHFHFTRVITSKRRSFMVLLSKIGVAFLHICLFIYCFMHVFH